MVMVVSITYLFIGEFVGYFAGANILMEYVLSNAGAARSFTEYFSVIFGESKPNSWRIEVQGLFNGHSVHLDFPAVALILILTLCLCKRSTSVFFFFFMGTVLLGV